ncbi:MAG: hypothetical protein KDI68_04305 [Gammaproteobacteria bacterium]|nr:hypothetical protein [Gammaproteobacteria bacterium]
MQKRGNHKHRKPDFLLVLFTVVGLATAATLTLHVHALSSTSGAVNEMIATYLKR